MLAHTWACAMLLCGGQRTICVSPLPHRSGESNTHWAISWAQTVGLLCEPLPLQKQPMACVYRKHLLRICFSTTQRAKNCAGGWKYKEDNSVLFFKDVTWQSGEEAHTSMEPPPWDQRDHTAVVQYVSAGSSPLRKCAEMKSTRWITYTCKVQYGRGCMLTQA